MFTRIRWQIAAGYGALIVIIMSSLAVYITRSGCRAEAGCAWMAVFVASILLIIGTLGITFFIVERTARPVRALTAVIQRAAKGDLHARSLPTNRDEVGQLVLAYNSMIEQVGQRLNLLAEERQQLSTVLATMADGVLIVDETNRVHLINPAAVRLLDIGDKSAIARSFAEVERHHRLIELLQQSQEEGQEQTAAIALSQE